ncbi:MAG TPA: carbohydrate ABC transporter permease [Anaerolineae bacterium]|nr:carbohydrate ABC transporter permease [Anaerolineae bacterium]
MSTHKNTHTKSLERKLHRKVIAKNSLNMFFTIIIYLVIIIVFASPMFYVIGNSMRNSQAIWSNAFPVSWKTFIPYEGISLANFKQTLGIGDVAKGLGMDISQNLLISLASAIAVVTSSLIFNTSAAYFFGRLKFPGKKFLLIFVVATMMIPQQVVIVPLYIVANKLHLINTFWALVVPWYSSPFVVFLLTQFMSDLPYEYDEAALIDGANQWDILWKVVLPNIIPGLITVSLLEFQFIWNEFYWPLIAVSRTKLYPVQVAVASQFTESGPNWGVVFAAMTLASLPVIILFLFLQRYFYESAAMSGIKG